MNARSCLLGLVVALGGIAPSGLFANEGVRTESWDDAFERRGYRLGITLQEFRAKVFPDKEFFPGAYPVCSNEPEGQSLEAPYVYITRTMETVGVVRCQHYYTNDIGYAREERAELLAGEWGTETDFYFVQPESADRYFLYKIVSTCNNGVFPQLRDAYKSVMETTSETAKSTVQNKLGAKFENVVVSWKNEVSMVELEKYYSDVDTMAITLTLKPLQKVVNERRKGVDKERGEKL